MSGTARLLLVRHGITAWNLEGRYTSRSDVALHADAHEALDATAALLRGERIDRVLSSPLRRCVETAEFLRARGDIAAPLELLDDLREMDFGEFEGRSRAELAASHLAEAYEHWMRVHDDFPTAPGGEAWADVSARAARVLAHAHTGTTLVVSHGYLLRTLIVTALADRPSGATREILLGNGGVTELRVGSSGSWELVSHDVGGVFPERLRHAEMGNSTGTNPRGGGSNG
ncbi:histidine phosphatase family protein [Salinibacterium sp. SYSU T00001]|uniref:histidine phosphatase family protein n=1 Tax=Homoserinimonas sedimenticola TaxID=2986805 RepID=UPI0022356CA2|nr:histidine phosphatase family protein [Salinibacterium sedimenticola]MCW4385590.1 histidine phosphatase family protein [Salinibacterium sedimenticola]